MEPLPEAWCCSQNVGVAMAGEVSCEALARQDLDIAGVVANDQYGVGSPDEP